MREVVRGFLLTNCTLEKGTREKAPRKKPMDGTGVLDFQFWGVSKFQLENKYE